MESWGMGDWAVVDFFAMYYNEPDTYCQQTDSEPLDVAKLSVEQKELLDMFASNDLKKWP
jgi:hypothetical protein